MAWIDFKARRQPIGAAHLLRCRRRRMGGFFFIDEFQSFTTLALVNMFSELRKYRVGFTVAISICTNSIRTSGMRCWAMQRQSFRFAWVAEGVPISQKGIQRLGRPCDSPARKLSRLHKDNDRRHAVERVQCCNIETFGGVTERLPSHPQRHA